MVLDMLERFFSAKKQKIQVRTFANILDFRLLNSVAAIGITMLLIIFHFIEYIKKFLLAWDIPIKPCKNYI